LSYSTNMDLENIVQQLKADLVERGNVVETMLGKTRDINKVVTNLESIALEKIKMIENLTEQVSSTKKLLEKERQDNETLEFKLRTTEREHRNNCAEMKKLRRTTEELQVKVEFKSSLENTFESLQKKFQQKVDELERVTKELNNTELL
jgi:chromosome segregation ATPase